MIDWALSLLGGSEVPVYMPPELQELIDGYLLMRSTGRVPWEAGMRLPVRRFWQAARILSCVFEQAALMRPQFAGCPLLGGGVQDGL